MNISNDFKATETLCKHTFVLGFLMFCGITVSSCAESSSPGRMLTVLALHESKDEGTAVVPEIRNLVYIPEDLKLQQHCCENVQSLKISVPVHVNVKGIVVPVCAVKTGRRSRQMACLPLYLGTVWKFVVILTFLLLYLG
jgi:hypothetical protein